MRLTWKKQPKNAGLSAIGSAPRGEILSLDGKELASVSASPTGWREWSGWFWSAPGKESLGIEYRNTHATPVDDIEAAKAECESYIRKCLGMPERKR